MNVEQIEKLIGIVEQSSLTEFSYKDAEVKITMSKLEHPPVIGAVSAVPAAPAAAAPETAAAAPTEEADEALLITSPIVGTFYSAPAPDAPAFVKVGDHVKN